jgi:choline dehydrogenase-like flavoprotein
VGDEAWAWKNAHGRYKRIENYHAPKDFEQFVKPNDGDHGHEGSLDIGFPLKWESTTEPLFAAGLVHGWQKNLDPNSGNPLGLSVSASSAYSGRRSTAADLLKKNTPKNLTIKTNAEVLRVVLDGRRATAIETSDGLRFHASKEIILSTGSMDTPRVLMHSGIGPADQLRKFDIPVLQANSHVGANLADHHHIIPTYIRKDGTTPRDSYFKSKELQAAAKTQWERDGTGVLSEMATSLVIAWDKLPSIFETSEFKALPQETQEFLQKPTVPTYELMLNAVVPNYYMEPETSPPLTSVFLFLLNHQSRGSVTLQSSDPRQPLRMDPNFFAHPFDKRLALEITRRMQKFIESPGFAKDTVGGLPGFVPESYSDEDILEFWKKNTGSTWHMSGTARMGKTADSSVVNSRFQVWGVENLRICDMSVFPVMINAHTQTGAYLAGLTLGDKLVEEYKLDGLDAVSRL